MNGMQKVVLKLLGELDALLGAEGIRYCLADKLAWDCWKNGRFSTGYYQACLMVSAENLDRLGDIEVRENRTFRTYVMPRNSHKMVRYVAEDSTLLAVDSIWQDAPGLGVELYPVERVSGGYEITTCRAESVHVTNDPLASDAKGTFEGLKLPLPGDVRTYLKELLGSKWSKQYTLPVETMRYGIVAAPETPYRDYLKEAVEAGAYDPAILETVLDYENWKATELAASAAALGEQTERFRLVMARFKMCEKYLPHRQALLSAWNDGRCDDVAFAMKDYTNRMKKFYTQGMVLRFDDELFDLALKVLWREKWPHVLRLRMMADETVEQGRLAEKVAPYLGC